MMTLKDVVQKISSLDREWTIYVAEPWKASSTAVVALDERGDGGVPAGAEELGLTYCLEVGIAQEFLQGWKENLGAEPGLDQQCARLVGYALTDA
jgi:hypothetical protein